VGASVDVGDSPVRRSRSSTRWKTVIEGKREAVQLAVTVLLRRRSPAHRGRARVGKTMLAKALAQAMDCTVRRIQFTPDLLPSDITGVSVYNQERRDFEFKPGAVFANVVIGDEINRASPKTQSALLECMAERQVTVDGTTYLLETPFIVWRRRTRSRWKAPIRCPRRSETEFTARISMGYPSAEAELEMVETPRRRRTAGRSRAGLRRVPGQQAHRRGTRRSTSADAVREYVITLVTPPDRRQNLRLGASPRATLHLIRTARAVAALDGRDFVIPEDIQGLAGSVLAHRVLATAEAQLSRRTPEQVIAEIVERTPCPDPVAAGPSIGALVLAALAV